MKKWISQLSNDHGALPFIQNRGGWCWAAAAKLVGLHYKECHPKNQFTIVSPHLDSEQAAKGYVTEEQLMNGVMTQISDGLRRNYVKKMDGFYYIDAWQRAIVMNANTQCVAAEGNFIGDDFCKIRALKFVVTGDIQNREIEVLSLGNFSDPWPLLKRYENDLRTKLQEGRLILANLVLETGYAHSAVLLPGSKENVYFFDPWDGFFAMFTLNQVFVTGVLTGQGLGVVKWIQLII